MNFRHAAALALVGWYLMMPPHTATKVLFHAPLKDWVNQGAFDTADECENLRSQLRYIMRSKAGLTVEEHRAIESAQCIASDDSRLKGD